MLEAPWHEYVGWGLLTIVKFAFTPSAMIAAGYNWLETFVTTSTASVIGVGLFYFFGDLIFNLFARLRRNPGRKFTKMNRRIVHMKSKYGLRGMGLIALFLSIPLAGLLTARFFHDYRKAVPALMLAFALWSFFLTSLSWIIKNLING